MDRNPSPPVPRVYTEAQPSTIFVYANTEKFIEMVRRFTGQTATTTPAAAAQRGAIVRILQLEPVQQHQSMLPTAKPPGRASGLVSQLTLSLPLSRDNPGPCVTNKAPDRLSLATSASASTISEDDEEMEDAEEVEMEDAEVEAMKQGRFYLLPSPPGEPKLLNLLPLAPSSSEGN